MRLLRMGLLLAMVLAWAAPAPAQGIFARRPKVNPSQRVPELILTVKTDPEERKRAHAAEELRDYDATTFTEIVPVLADVLLHDKKVSVRLEALGSLVRIRPVSALAGQAIEKAAAADESWRVRLQAKTALPKYHLAGSLARKMEPAAAKKTPTNEPPIVTPAAPPQPPPLPRVESVPRPLPRDVAPPTQGPALFPEK